MALSWHIEVRNVPLNPSCSIGTLIIFKIQVTQTLDDEIVHHCNIHAVIFVKFGFYTPKDG